MPTPDNLIILTTPAVRDATRAYLKSRDAAAFERAMQQALAKAHTAAYVRGTADRTGVMPKGLSRAERGDVKAKLKEQFDFLKGFMQAAPDLSDAQVAQRAALYVGAGRATYYSAAFPGLPFYPTQGSECMANCKCSWEQQGDSYYWRMAAAEHCPTCRSRAAGNPYKG